VIRQNAYMRPSMRQAEICDLIAKRGEMSVGGLAVKFDASAETIRRDLTTLADAGQIRKVHGGARALSPQGEGVFDVRMRRNALAKRLIAEKVVALVAPRQTVFLDTGSTTLICAEAMARIKKLTVITNSTRIAATFAKGAGGTDVYLLGGRYRGGNAQTVGCDTTNEIARFRADMAIITVAAIDAGNAMDFSNDEAQVARAMISASAQTVIVADHTKFNRAAPFNVCNLNGINTLVSDKAPNTALERELYGANVNVL
jgi:DeoR family glycerol-3-phosphate regulon repressor